MREDDRLVELPDDRKLMAVAPCPTCGKDVWLYADADQWQEQDDGSWAVTGYGPALGECCDQLIADWWEGCFVYDLRRPASPGAASEGGTDGE